MNSSLKVNLQQKPSKPLKQHFHVLTQFQFEMEGRVKVDNNLSSLKPHSQP